MNLGKAIKSLRKKLVISQTELAEKCHISQSALSCIEMGKKLPAPATIRKICSVLNITEPMIYLLAIQEKDISEGKLEVYKVVHPMIEILVSKIASYDVASYMKEEVHHIPSYSIAAISA